MSIAIIYISGRGKRTAEEIIYFLKGADIFDGKKGLKQTFDFCWGKYDKIVAVMAAGVAVRMIAHLLRDKKLDPCVVVVDEYKKSFISLVGGHLGGGNRLALYLAAKMDGYPVITTASDLASKTPLDIWIRENNLLIENQQKLTAITASFNESDKLKIFFEVGFRGDLPQDFEIIDDLTKADVYIGHAVIDNDADILILRPKTLGVGIGCNRNTTAKEIKTSFLELCSRYDLKKNWICKAATIDVKINEEGILQFVSSLGIPLCFYNRSRLNSIKHIQPSAAVIKAVGAIGVAEPASILSMQEHDAKSELYIKKVKWKNVTMAVARGVTRFREV